MNNWHDSHPDNYNHFQQQFPEQWTISKSVLIISAGWMFVESIGRDFLILCSDSLTVRVRVQCPLEIETHFSSLKRKWFLGIRPWDKLQFRCRGTTVVLKVGEERQVIVCVCQQELISKFATFSRGKQKQGRIILSLYSFRKSTSTTASLTCANQGSSIRSVVLKKNKYLGVLLRGMKFRVFRGVRQQIDLTLILLLGIKRTNRFA